MPNGIEILERRLEDIQDFYNRSDEFFIALGRDSEWSDESNPPELTGDSSDVSDFESSVFGYVNSSVDIEPIPAKVIIGSGTNGEVTIEVDETYKEGKNGNGVECNVVDTSGTADLTLVVDWDLTNEILTIEPATDSSGNIISTAQEISDEVNSIPELVSYYFGDGTGVFDSGDAGSFVLDGGEGPTKKACYIVEDEEGSILYQGVNYRKIYDKDFESEKPVNLYFKILIPTDVFSSIDSYRQLGIYYNLTRADGVSSDKDILEPSEVADKGTLYSISNFRRVLRRDDRFETTVEVIEF